METPQGKIDVSALFTQSCPQLSSTAKRYLFARVSFACARRAVFYSAAPPQVFRRLMFLEVDETVN
jgi:hypothetical protein